MGIISPICRLAPRSSQEAGGPPQITPETSTLVSATAFKALAALGADGVYLRLDFVHGHRLIVRVGAHLVHHLAVSAQRFFHLQFAFNQPANLSRVEQAFSPRLGGQRLRQIQLDRNAHNPDNMPAMAPPCQIGAEHGDAR